LHGTVCISRGTVILTHILVLQLKIAVAQWNSGLGHVSFDAATMIETLRISKHP
jgi:hypothetical protein